jgi:hypothetical protein
MGSFIVFFMNKSIMTAIGIIIGLIAFGILIYFVRSKLYGMS